ncbi:N-succinylarginine dihydrolase [Thalassotalea agarivorans]|uniref:N-succinylarginine dihydrolase n=1 Tax=Thalassotalea agarivorans TaxID=349064 RepID=A0A1I0FIW0_THASX|nr:N-succinylarginine dihydrolase [Thalassotalea agarivorans]SET57158.1 succinylarginine dihydrolase [Thalassotalea agarivorans]
MSSIEANFDGLVGPTHNYAGLSEGNVASLNNAQSISSPKKAAKQGLAKMKALHDMGFVQGVLAPQARPDIGVLRRVGFGGNDQQVLEKAYKHAPVLLSACFSASSMWTANAATVSPSGDTQDGKIHFTPANLTNKFHRSIEPKTTGNILKAVFNDEATFSHHEHLPENDHFGDEGAANHTRLCQDYGKQGIEIFTFGRYAFNRSMPKPTIFPARQTKEASEAIARLHQLNEKNTVYVQQNPDVIDQGVFHNDVIAVGNRNVLFYHEQAFLNTDQFKQQLQERFEEQLYFVEAPTEQVSVEDCVSSYLFNTQLVSHNDNEMSIIAPMHCKENEAVYRYLQSVVQADNPISNVHYFDVNESMKNGGGPACLRLRVALTENEVNAVNPQCLLNDDLFNRLNQWIDKYYRDQLAFSDLKDGNLLKESYDALDELTKILNIGNVYSFQQ